jgi:DNA-3-methyladenine glycosylase I
MSEPERCGWAGPEPIYIAYHDEEWGVPNADERAFFEKLLLEGFQAGLSWITVLKKRARFREVFDNFDAGKMARYDQKKIGELLTDPGIIRHRGKIEAAIANARAYLDLREKTTLAAFVWDFVDGQPQQNAFRSVSEMPAQTDISTAMSKALKGIGFRFCGPTSVYAFMQSMGLVNDHLVSCHRHADCAALAGMFAAPKG